jgi:hypothetical protein
MSNVEGLTTPSDVEGQITNPNDQNLIRLRRTNVLNIGYWIFEFVYYLGIVFWCSAALWLELCQTKTSTVKSNPR